MLIKNLKGSISDIPIIMTDKVELEPYGGSSLYLLNTITPLHVGAGRAVGLVDLPVERDGFGLPTIPSSGIKGALREHFRGNPFETAIFGQRVQEVESYAGALTILDALLVAMPVRSLKGVWALATSPFILRRLKEYMSCANIDSREVENAINAFGGLTPNEVILSEGAREIMEIDGNLIINEEFKLAIRGESNELTELAKILHLPESYRLIGIHDNLVRPIVERSLLRRARIKLQPETKTVEGGALWYEEDVPANTVFATLIAYGKLRISDDRIKELSEDLKKEAEGMKKDAGKVREYVESKMLKNGLGYLILGGHETIGRGLVKLLKVKQG
jgi:CRISPR-associated protein Cmr4